MMVATGTCKSPTGASRAQPVSSPARPSAAVAEALVGALVELGVKQAFGVTGAANAPFCRALAQSSIRFVHCRHESGAAFAACEASLASDAPTLVFTTTGPGLHNAINGLATARHEGAKVLLVSGATSAAMRGRVAVQETSPADAARAGQLFHYVAGVEDPAELDVVVARVAVGFARPQGFVAHVSLPLSVQTSDGGAHRRGLVRVPGAPVAPPSLASEVAARLSEGPFLIWLGYGARGASDAIRAFVATSGAPVICTPRAKGIVAESSPQFLGVTGLGGYGDIEAAVAKLKPRHVLVLGTRMGEGSSFWSPSLAPTEAFLHVDLDDTAFGSAFPGVPTLGIRSDVGAFVEMLRRELPASAPQPDATLRRPDPPSLAFRAMARVREVALMQALQKVVVEGSNAIVLADSGNAAAWATHCLRFDAPGRYRVSPGMGSMSHAAAGVVGASLATGRKAVAVVGDGSMLMQNEVSTAVAYGVDAVWVVLNDGRYGMVHHGLRGLGWEPFATSIPSCDFRALAISQGAAGLRVDCETQLESALGHALSIGGPVVLDVLVEAKEPAPIGARIMSLSRQGVDATPAGTA